MLPIFCCVFLCLGQALAKPSASQYIDTLVHTSLQSIIGTEKLDPTLLVSYTFDYEDKTFLGKVKGKAEYTEGTLNGLSTVIRHSDCSGARNSNGTTAIRCELSFSKLETSYKGRVKYGVLPKVTIQAKGNVQNMILDVVVLQGSTDRYPRIGFFKIKSFGTMTTTFTGLGPLNKHMKVLEENYKQKVSMEVSHVINLRFENALREAVKNVPLPHY